MKTAEMQVTLIDKMGSDLTVVNAARVSFDKESGWDRTGSGTGDVPESKLSDRDTKLIGYLASHNHWTPFGHCFAQFRIKAPIFVARQLVKHQVGLVWNEVSRRYVDSEPEFWFPKVWRGRPEGSIKQGSSGVVNIDAYKNLNMYSFTLPHDLVASSLSTYEHLLFAGVAPEQARMILPLNMMTEWYWSGSLAAWARVCKLRLDPHAQQETAEVAQMIDSYMKELFPVSWKELMK